jgi:hypothetical protein
MGVESEDTHMESFMNGTMLVEATLLSFLLALWMTWLGLNGLFRLLPVTSPNAASIKFVANQRAGNRRQHAA